MTQSPRKFVSAFTSSTTNRGVEAKEIEIANTQLDTDGSQYQESDVELRSQASGDTGSYLQVVVQKHKKKDPTTTATQTSPRLPTASSPLKRPGEIYLLQHPMLLAYPNATPNATEEKPVKDSKPFWAAFKETDTTPDKVDLYYFERQSSDYLATSDGTFTYSERFAARLSRIPNRVVAEIFAVPQILISIPIAMILNLERSVFITLRGLLVGSVQIWSDYILKPLITLTFNAVVQPPLVLVGNVGNALREAVRPLAAMVGDFIEPVVKVLGAFKLVSVGKCNCSHNV